MEDLTFLLLVIVTSVIVFFSKKYSYWKRKNVPGPKPVPFLGNYKDFFTIKKTVGMTVQDIYNKYSEEAFVGAYFGTEPVLIPRDLEIIRTIMTKDFHKFHGRLLVEHEFRDPSTSNNLFSTSGDMWKTLRQNLNPMFTSGKLKNYFGHITECAGKLDSYLFTLYKQSNEQDFKDICTNFILECVGTTLFGMHFEAMCPEDNVLKKLAYDMEHIKLSTFIKNNIREVCPNWYHIFTQKTPLFESFDKMFTDMAKSSFEAREYKQIGRKDLIDFLIKFKEQGYIEGDGIKDVNEYVKRVKLEVTDSLLVAQVLVFFGAGFSTSSTTLSFTLFELAKHSDIQMRLINEIEQVLNQTNGEVTYESINEMKYLDMVVSETLRKYPVVGIVTRECMDDYKFLDHDLKIDKGLRIHIPIWAIHYDPKYYPEPDKFDPERFSPEEVKKRHPYSFLAFGEGHRICIGMRFAKIQVAVGLIRILRKYKLELSASMPRVLTFDVKGLATIADIPILLKMTPRENITVT